MVLPNRKKLLVTGAGGFLGWNLCRMASGRYEVTGVYHRRQVDLPNVSMVQCDLTSFTDVKAMMRQIRPEAVIHAAAIASPDRCLENPFASRHINVDAAVSLAGLCSEAEIPCLFISTDLVFDGTAPPYSEASAPSPINLYGEQKVEAEQAMRARHGDVIICRMPLLFGDVPPGALSSIQPLIRALTEGTALALFIDEFRTPVSGATAASGLLTMLEKKPGLIHLGGKERISRYDFGKLVAAALGKDGSAIREDQAANSRRPAARPPDVSLDSSKAFSLGYRPPAIEEEIARLDCVRLAKGDR